MAFDPNKQVMFHVVMPKDQHRQFKYAAMFEMNRNMSEITRELITKYLADFEAGGGKGLPSQKLLQEASA